MSYEIERSVVRYKGKVIVAALPESFHVGDGRVGWDAKQVYFFGKPRPVDRSSFEYLDSSYSKDCKSVYCVVGTQIKTLGKADPGTFKAIADGYGEDAKRVFLRGKWIAGARPASFRVFDSHLSADDKWIFSDTLKIASTANKFAARDIRRMFADRDEFGNVLSLVVVTDEAVWVKDGRLAELEHLVGADSKSFEILGCGHAKDALRFYANYRPVPGFAVDRLRPLAAPHAWTDEALVVLDGELLPDADPGSFTRATDEYFVDAQHGYRRGRPPFQMDAAALDDQQFKATLQQVVDRLVAHFMAVFDSWLPICERKQTLSGVCWRDARYPVPEVEAEVEAGVLRLHFEGHIFEGTLASIDIPISHVWSLQRYGTPFRRYVHESGWSYPSGNVLISETVSVGGKALMQLANTLFLRGYPDDAILLAAWLEHLSGKPELREEWISGLCPQVFTAQPPEPPTTKATSNLARAKEIVATKLVSDPDPLVRQRAYLELYGLMYETNKYAEFLKRIVPSIIKSLQHERHPSLRDACLAFLDLTVTRVFLVAERRDAYLYREVRPLVNALIDECFNLDLNLLRGLECARALSDIQAAQALATQVEEVIPGEAALPAMCTGLHVGYPNREFWLLDSELRIASARGKLDDPELERSLLQRLGKLRMKYGYREALENYQDLMSSLDRINPGALFEVCDATPTFTHFHRAQKLARSATFSLEGFHLLSQGLYEQYAKSHAPDKPLFRLTQAGNRFTIRQGDRIGLEYLPDGFPWGRYLDVSVVVEHPPIAGSNQTIYSDNLAGLGISNGFFWHFETAEECVSGEWQIRLEFEGKTVLDVRFDIAT